MFAPDFHRNSLPRLVSFLIVVALGSLWILSESPSVSSQGGSAFKNFESPQVHPLAMTPDGTRLLAVNSPNATLSVFQLVSGSPVLTAEIPVGFEPVSVAARNNREAWVVNWMSDSVSIVDLTLGNVVRTFDVGDEPTDVIFAGAGNSKAFVCVSGGSQDFTGSIQVTGASGAVKVFDANNPTGALTTIQNFGKQPRALARNADGSRVFVSIFESGNQTTVVPEPIVLANGGLPPPNPPVSPGLPVPPNTSLIVKWDGSNWRDEINRSWTTQIPFTLSDTDVLVLDAADPGSNVIKVRGIGTHVGNMAFNSSADQLLVVNLEDINQVRFEPNIRGRFQASRVSILNTALATPALIGPAVDLNSHVDFGNPGGSDAERAQSLALPADVVRQSDGTVYVAATSSAKVGVLTSAGSVTGRIPVGQGPTGLALDESRQRLYVLNRFDQTLSVVDTGTKAELSQISIGFNPEPASVRNGRIFLYDARNLSSHGTVSCASCHLNGHRDGMVWDLGNPQGSTDFVTTSLPTGFIGSDNLHPMKGPMMTQSLRGIIGNEPFHWRGDRAGLENFNGAFVSLLGGRLLTNEEMASFKAFVASLTYPPNPNEFPSRFPSQNGFFSFNKLFGPGTSPTSGGTLNCDQCHLLPNFAIGSDKKITPKADLIESQSVKVPHFRGLYQKVGMRKIAGEQLTGFGFTHDGSFDTLFNFQKAPQFNFGQAGSEATADGWRISIEDMILRFDTGLAPAVGMMVTVDATNKGSASGRISFLDQQAAAGNCDLVVRGFYFGSPRSFLRVGFNLYQPDSRSEPIVSLETLMNAIGSGNELTFMGVPPGQGSLFALDRNGNGILNDDEPRTSVSITGRTVNASGVGLAGVTVTLSGTQSASAVTDSNGKFVFNLVSINGSHTVTPSSGGVTFFPSNRTFTNPSWNQSATFIASSSANASDASVFFVTQHYNDFLNREPDANGLAFWVNEIEQCGADAQCREIKRINVSAAFYLAIEFKETGYLVYRAYKTAFGKLPGKPVPVTFTQLMNDTQRVGHNVQVGIGNWQAVLDANQQAFFTGLVQRPEFLAQFPTSMPALDFVNKLDVNTGDALSDAERDGFVNQLNAAGNSTAGRAAVVRAVAGDQTLFDAEFNKAFVLMQYCGYLRRDPDSAPDTNFDGWQFWFDKLNQFNGNFVNAEMVKAFITSIEYRNRFGQ